jgi:hypothetical protein
MMIEKKAMLPITSQYWLSKDDSLGQGLLLQEFGIFLKKCGKKLAKGADIIAPLTLEDISDQQFEKIVLRVLAKCEWGMRAELQKACDNGESTGHSKIPPAILPEPKDDEEDGKEVRIHSF